MLFLPCVSFSRENQKREAAPASPDPLRACSQKTEKRGVPPIPQQCLIKHSASPWDERGSYSMPFGDKPTLSMIFWELSCRAPRLI